MDIETLLALVKKLPPGEQEVILKLLEEHEEADRVERARSHFLDFVKETWDGFIAGAHHKRMCDAFDRVIEGKSNRLIINLPPRHSKALALDTPILTPTGFKDIASLEVGDFVYGPDGLPTRVIGKSEVFTGSKCYRVDSLDGYNLVCDANHLWLGKDHDGPETVRSAEKWAEISHRQGRRIRIPQQAAINLPKADLPVDPYALGLWLGDGCSSHCTITAHDDHAPHLRAELMRRGVATSDRATRFSFGMLGVWPQMIELGLKRNKHIPEIYFYGSAEQRTDLLRGLMDSDGNVSKQGQSLFNTSSERLRDDARRLLTGLGIKSSVAKCRASIGDKDYGLTYRITFYKPGTATIPHKAERQISTAKQRYISFTEVLSVPTQCIQVERPDGLFLAGDGLFVTHNSELASIRLPAYFLGKDPGKKVIAASHTADLAVNFGRKVRDLIMDPAYQRIFPDTQIKQDAKAAGKWVTTSGGEYYAVGVGGALAGRGADLAVLDDPHSEQDAMQGEWSPEIWDKAFDWFNTGPRQRLQPGGKIVIVMTRWATRDLTGMVLKKALEHDKASEWEVIELPAILPSGNPLWPEYWTLEELAKVKADIPLQRWNAQYQQQPTASEGAILKREYWKRWLPSNMPKCEMILQSWDTAYGMKQRNDYSACTTWGVFETESNEKKVKHLILLDYFKDKMEFPALKAKVRELYKKWNTDTLIVEAKAAGAPLIFELRAMGIPVSEYTPARGNDKIVRANAITDMFKSGMIWAPETKWAEELIEECQAFPNGDCDDGVDTLTQALLRFRQGGLISTSNDDEDDKISKRKRAAYY